MVSIPPGSALGRYRVVEQLGRGGMATVFRAHDPTLDRYVAVKVLPSYYTEDPTFVGRFSQEAQTIARLSHPNILQIYDFGEDKGFTYIVSELVPGGTLLDRLGSGPLSTEETLHFMRPLAEALDYAHAQRIIHRDLKPANILLDAEARPILADFGLARMLESSTRFTQTSQALGTPEYMAPEQAMGGDADHRSDLYAFGIILYQMLLGQTPFRADTPAATLMAHVHKPLPLPTSLDPNISPRLEATLLKATAKNPDDRFQSAKEMIQSLTIATGQQREAAADDLGATAVLDAADLDMEDVSDSPTAVVGAGTAAEGVAAAPSIPREGEPEAVEAEPGPPRGRRWLYVGSVAGLVVIAALIAVVLFIPGADKPDETDTQALDTSSAVSQPSDGVQDEAAKAPEVTGSGTTVEEAPSTEVASQAASQEPAPAVTLAEALAALDKLTSRVAQNVIKLRTLDPGEEIDTQLRTRDQLDVITKGFFRRETLRQQVFEAQELYKALDLMDDGQDLEAILVGIQLQQVSALFDDESEAVYVLSDTTSIGPVEELAYASAYMGGTQQKLFDISKLRRESIDFGTDSFRAVNALIVGDVAQVGKGYITTVFTRDQAAELSKPLPENKLLTAPRIVREAVLFPINEGADFVAELFGTDKRGWDGVNDAYSNPPMSTEQILHPEKYFSHEEPQRTTVLNIAPQLGKGWVQISANTMGEFLIGAYLEEHLDSTQAADAAAGWGGDRYSLLSGPEGERLLLSLIKWDTFLDSVEFFDAYQVFAAVKTQGAGGASTRLGDDAQTWSTPEQTIFLGRDGDTTLLIIGHDQDTVGKALQLIYQSLEIPTP